MEYGESGVGWYGGRGESVVYPGQQDLERLSARIAESVRGLLPDMAERDLGAVVMAVAYAAFEVNDEAGG